MDEEKKTKITHQSVVGVDRERRNNEEEEGSDIIRSRNRKWDNGGLGWVTVFFAVCFNLILLSIRNFQACFIKTKKEKRAMVEFIFF